MARATELSFRSTVHELHRVGFNVDNQPWGFKLYHQDAAGTYSGECRKELDVSISLAVVVDASPARWFFRYSIPEVADLLVSALADVRAGRFDSLIASLDAAESSYDRETLQQQLYAGKGPFVALVVSVSNDHFPDEDDICLVAGTYLARQLESHLAGNGHTVPDWIRGGCAEDWGVYLESRKGKDRYQYRIMFFPRGSDDRSMAIQYGIKLGFWRRLLRGQPALCIDDPLHLVMWSFGTNNERPQLLTKEQIDAGLHRPP